MSYFYSNTVYFLLKIVNFLIFSTSYGYLLSNTDASGHNLELKPNSGSMFEGDINLLRVDIDELDSDVLHLQVSKST